MQEFIKLLLDPMMLIFIGYFVVIPTAVGMVCLFDKTCKGNK